MPSKHSICPSCGYSLRGIIPDHCPECGKVISRAELEADRPRGFWRVHVFHTIGFAATAFFNIAVFAVLVRGVFKGRESWFTAPWLPISATTVRARVNFSWASLIVVLLIGGLIGWAAKTEEPGWDHGWSMQRGLAVWCWVLTVAHLVGTSSLWW